MKIITPRKNANFSGYHKKDIAERLNLLLQEGVIDEVDLKQLSLSSSPELLASADNMIENVIGCFPVPLGLALNCYIGDRNLIIPMAVEETSIVAALSGAGKWMSQNKATISASTKGRGINGQVYFCDPETFSEIEQCYGIHREEFIHKINTHILSSMQKRGGGVVSLNIRLLDSGILACDLVIDCCDAMGANLICQSVEMLKKLIFERTGVNGSIAIVSNLSDCQVVRATVNVKVSDPVFASKVSQASKIAQADIYRAVTHNKGITNGIDALAIATGNDWRAIEASLHGFASIGGYKPLTTWKFEGNMLIGEFEGPIPAGAVGGATCQPLARICRKILGCNNAQELIEIMATVGLLQNFAAIRALVTSGIVAGHMRLHISNIVALTDASKGEASLLKEKLQENLHILGKVTATDAFEILQKIRGGCA